MITPHDIAKMLDHSLLKPEMDESTIRRGLEVAKKYDVASIGVRPCMGSVDPERQEALWQRCREALEHHFDGPLTPESGSTDANIPWSLGIPSCTVGCVDTGGAHTYEEWINARQAPEGLAFLLRLVLSYCED